LVYRHQILGSNLVFLLFYVKRPSGDTPLQHIGADCRG
jgi:hypothetical protein